MMNKHRLSSIVLIILLISGFATAIVVNIDGSGISGVTNESVNFYSGNYNNLTNIPSNFPNNTVAGNLVNWNATYNATYDAKEPAISTGVASQFWNGLKQWIALNIGNVTGLQETLNAINYSKANKSNIGEFTGGTLLSSVYGTGIYVSNISDYYSNLTGQGFITNLTAQLTEQQITGLSANINSSNRLIQTVNFIIDGGGSVITTGHKSSNFSVGFNGTIKRIEIDTDVVGNLTIALTNKTDDITGGNNIVLSSANNLVDETLMGWNTTVKAYDTKFRVRVNSSATITNAVIKIFILRD